MSWQDIDSAPKDGTWVLLKGGRDFGDDPVGPAVVAFWESRGCFPAGWTYAWWDGDWRSGYEDPTQWMNIPS